MEWTSQFLQMGIRKDSVTSLFYKHGTFWIKRNITYRSSVPNRHHIYIYIYTLFLHHSFLAALRSHESELSIGDTSTTAYKSFRSSDQYLAHGGQQHTTGCTVHCSQFSTAFAQRNLQSNRCLRAASPRREKDLGNDIYNSCWAALRPQRRVGWCLVGLSTDRPKPVDRGFPE